MNTIVRLEDVDLLWALADYRVTVNDKHGPLSLDAFSAFIAEQHELEVGPSKATLSNRLNGLIKEGYLSALRDEGNGLLTFTLDLTDEGRKVLENGSD